MAKSGFFQGNPSQATLLDLNTLVLAAEAHAAEAAASAASIDVSTFLVKASNLSDLTSAATARTNLGLGTAAVANLASLGPIGATTGTFSGIITTPEVSLTPGGGIGYLNDGGEYTVIYNTDGSASIECGDSSDLTNYHFSHRHLFFDSEVGLTFKFGIYDDRVVVAQTTASSSTTTGALVVSGGAGIAGALNVGTELKLPTTGTAATAAFKIASDYRAFATGLSMFHNAEAHFFYNYAGTNYQAVIADSGVAISATTASTSTTTGALTVAGGVGVAGNVWASGYNLPLGSALYDTQYSPTVRYTILRDADGDSNIWLGDSGDPANYYYNDTHWFGNRAQVGILEVNATGVKIYPTTASTSTTTGALKVAGGVGIAGALNVGGSTTVTGQLIANGNVWADTTYNLVPGGGMLNFSGADGYTALADGSGMATLYCGGTLDPTNVYRNTTHHFASRGAGSVAFGILDATGLQIVPTTASTSSTTGALKVAGGAGIAGDLNVGGTAKAAGFNLSGSLGGVTLEEGTAYTVISTGADGAGGSIWLGDVDTANYYSNTSHRFSNRTGTVSLAVLDGTKLDIKQTTASTGSTTGALTVAGGAGIAGALYVGGAANLSSPLQFLTNGTGAGAWFDGNINTNRFFLGMDSGSDVALRLYAAGVGNVWSYNMTTNEHFLNAAVSVSGNIGFYGTAPAAKPTITGSRGGNAALASLITSLASIGLLTDSTTS